MRRPLHHALRVVFVLTILLHPATVVSESPPDDAAIKMISDAIRWQRQQVEEGSEYITQEDVADSYGVYAKLDFPAAIEMALQSLPGLREPDSESRGMWITGIFKAISREDVDDAIEKIPYAHPYEVYAQAGVFLVGAELYDESCFRVGELTKPDLRRVLETLDMLNDSGDRTARMCAILLWATEEAETAVQWVLKREPSEQRVFDLSIAIPVLWTENPARAAKLADELTVPEEREAVIDLLVRNWSKRDHKAALAWVNTLSTEPPSRVSLLFTIGSDYGAEHPDEAFSWASSLPPEHSYGAIPAVIHGIYNTQDPRVAATYIPKIEEYRTRSRAAGDLFRYWYRQDAQAAWKWASGYPEARIRDWLARVKERHFSS